MFGLRLVFVLLLAGLFGLFWSPSSGNGITIWCLFGSRVIMSKPKARGCIKSRK
jgi:hypothetical protein